MNHAVLLGDSILDNGIYVPDNPSVIDQLKGKLNSNWDCSLLAVDGDVTGDVIYQLKNVPKTATHFIVSCGGNDALTSIGVLGESVSTVSDAMSLFSEIRKQFKNNYSNMLKNILKLNKPIAVCTVYDSIPDIEQEALTALSIYNEIILKEAFRVKIPVIDLRLTFTEQADYSVLSPIEPSVQGGEKITDVIKFLLENHNYSSNKSVIYY
jgi:lysophospholipase L1-like esterase